MESNVDYNKLLEQFNRSVVMILIYRGETNPANSRKKWWPVTNIPGIVTVSGSTFCHIMVCSRKFFCEGPCFRYEVKFQDKTSVNFDVNTVQDDGFLAAFYVPTHGKKVDAVQFNKQNAAWREKVWVFGHDHCLRSLLDKGTITHIGNGKFDHDCPANSHTASGYPVFNMDTNLVGISYYDYGVTHTLDVKQMTHFLSTIFEGMTEKPLVEILQHIKILGEAKYGVPRLGNHEPAG